MRNRNNLAVYVRSFVFGVEDSLVSTVGLLSGVAIAGVEREIIFLTGVILIFVEAFSMAVGSFLSEHSASEYIAQNAMPFVNSIFSGIVMFFSYFISGFAHLFPYLFFSVNEALIISIVLSLAALFILGIVSANFSKTNLWRGGFKMFLIGGLAIVLGILIGGIVRR